MPQVCVSKNLKITGGGATLGLEKWAAPRMVAQVSATSVGDGTISSSGLTTQPGRLMIDTSISWASDSPLPALMRLQVIRPYRTLISSNPNAVEIWEAWNYRINGTPAVPTYDLVNSLCTMAPDLGTDVSTQPFKGVVYQDYPAGSSEELIELPAGSTLNVRYVVYVWTPPPWSNNASANAPVHEAYSRGVKLRLWAFPTLDAGVA